MGFLMKRRHGHLKTLVRSPLLLQARLEERLMARRPHDELAVCAIFREEAPFLEEWLNFHSGVGATHFYLYNNFSTDSFRTVLTPWIAQGKVTLHDWPRPVGQLSAYRHCVRHYRRQARWVAFIDLDEFLFSPQSVDLRCVLREYADCPGVLVYGVFFGSSGHAVKPPGLLTDNFTRCAPSDVACSGKTIANPRMIYAIRSPHVFHYWSGETLDTRRRSLDEGRSSPVFDRLRYNHYWSRSLDDLHTKVWRGDASTPEKRDLDWHLEYEAQLNSLEDRTILPITEAIRAGTR